MTARDMELVACHWTLAGALPGIGRPSRFPLKDRLRAAARAGYVGVGLLQEELDELRERIGYAGVAELLAESCLQHVELEFLTDWHVAGARRRRSDAARRKLLSASRELGARYVKVGDLRRSPLPFPELVEAFAQLCAEAREEGARIGLEIMGCSIVDSLEAGVRLVEESGAENGGLVIDIYQMVNLGIPFERLGQLPQGMIQAVELNDGTLPGQPDHDPSFRRLCGEGGYDIAGFVAALRRSGYAGPWSVEVIDPELAQMELEEAAELSFNGAERALQEATSDE